jgi:RNA polymerase sigma-70 factor (ECF subfamily)
VSGRDRAASSRPVDVTVLLDQWSREGRSEALDELMTALYDDLRRAAAAHMRRERREHTLQVTGLVNEAFVRLAAQRQEGWENRGHFLAVAATCMRRVLVDHARRRGAVKRPQELVPLDDAMAAGLTRIDQVLPLHEALERLAALDPRQAAMVEQRFFADLSLEDVAAASGVSVATAKRELRAARAFLRTCLEPST